MNVTLTRWASMSPDERNVVLDGLLERLPEGYVHARDVGNEAVSVPQFIHRSTSVLFHLLFEDEVIVGASDARCARACAVNAEAVELIGQASASPMRPARRLRVPAMLVGEVLSGHQLQRLGVPESVITPWGVRAAGVGAALVALARIGWRAPSEVEWEFALRAGMDSLDDTQAPTAPTLRLFHEMGARLELCRDSWHPDWNLAPATSEPWGEGHEVLRGQGKGSRLVRWGAPAGWAECLWSGRHALAQAREPVAIRPWVAAAID